jgi:hypothetical protein
MFPGVGIRGCPRYRLRLKECVRDGERYILGGDERGGSGGFGVEAAAVRLGFFSYRRPAIGAFALAYFLRSLPFGKMHDPRCTTVEWMNRKG